MHTKQTGVLYPVQLIEQMQKVKQIRRGHEGYDTCLSRIYAEAVEQYLKSIDWETGRPKPPVPTVPQSPILVADTLPTFGSTIGGNQFGDDAALFRVMDTSWMMLWAAGPTNNCLHANPVLTEYTGCSMAQLLQAGWAGLLHPDDRERTWAEVHAGFRSRRPFTVFYRWRRGDGAWGRIVDYIEPRYRPDATFAGFIGTMYQVGLDRSGEGLPRGGQQHTGQGDLFARPVIDGQHCWHSRPDFIDELIGNVGHCPTRFFVAHARN